MNPTITRLLISALGSLWLFISPTDARAQAPGIAPELATLAAKYKADTDALAPKLDQAIAAAARPYLEALEAAEQKSTQAGRAEEVKAILEEKRKVTNAKRQGPNAAPLLPKGVLGARTTYVREYERCEREHAARAKQLSADYLRALGSIETAARSRKQDTLLAQIDLLKRDLLREAGGAAPAGPSNAGSNLVANGDFSRKRAADAPVNWGTGGPVTGSVITERNESFLRFSAVESRQEAVFRQSFDRSPNLKELAVAARIRCSSMQGSGKISVNISERNAAGKVIKYTDAFSPVTEESRDWKQLSGTVVLQPETVSITVRLRSVGALTTVDFDDVHVEAR